MAYLCRSAQNTRARRSLGLWQCPRGLRIPPGRASHAPHWTFRPLRSWIRGSERCRELDGITCLMLTWPLRVIITITYLGTHCDGSVAVSNS
eukprot:4135012-Prymnesium_polylepis.1